MKYLCKKTYSKEIIAGNFYDYYLTSTKNYVKIEELYFVANNNMLSEPKIYKYFYTETEIRKIKLEKLKEFK